MSEPLHYMVDAAPTPPGPFNHAVDCDDFLFLSGQIAQDPNNPTATLQPSITEQTHQCMRNLSTVLEAFNLSLRHAVSVRVFLTHFGDDYESMNAAYAEYFPADRRPVRTTIGVTGLAMAARVEIDLIARRF